MAPNLCSGWGPGPSLWHPEMTAGTWHMSEAQSFRCFVSVWLWAGFSALPTLPFPIWQVGVMVPVWLLPSALGFRVRRRGWAGNVVMPWPGHRSIWLDILVMQFQEPIFSSSALHFPKYSPPTPPPSQGAPDVTQHWGWTTNLLLMVIHSDEGKGYCVQGAGHHAKQGAHGQGGVDIREEPDESRS